MLTSLYAIFARPLVSLSKKYFGELLNGCSARGLCSVVGAPAAMLCLVSALVAACRKLGCGQVRWVGDPERLEAKLLPANDIPLVPQGLSRPRVRKPSLVATGIKRMAGVVSAK